jgi:hypothetical protein
MFSAINHPPAGIVSLPSPGANPRVGVAIGDQIVNVAAASASPYGKF